MSTHLHLIVTDPAGLLPPTRLTLVTAGGECRNEDGRSGSAGVDGAAGRGVEPEATGEKKGRQGARLRGPGAGGRRATSPCQANVQA